MKRFLYLITLAVLISSCEESFEYSPFESKVSGSLKSTTQKMLSTLLSTETTDDTLTIALISDSHIYYSELKSVVDKLNTRTDVDFVIHLGDVTESGLLKEYENFHSIMGKYRKPYFTVIGNHDCLAYGESIYKSMFGNLNYTINRGDNYFIFFNSVVWESGDTPDFVWLENELKKCPENSNIFIVSHIPPYTDQWVGVYDQTFYELCKKYNVKYVLNGHNHNHEEGVYEGTNTQYWVNDFVKKKSFSLLKIHENSISIQSYQF